MNQFEYDTLHKMIKVLKLKKTKKAFCCAPGKQRVFNGHAILNKDIKFRVIQNRKAHRSKDEKKKVSYLLWHNNELMIRVDYHGQMHKGTPTPHMHIYDEKHQQFDVAIPLEDIANYNPSDEIVQSFLSFLGYNNFNTSGLDIGEELI